MKKIKVNEIFYSIQGEGYRKGSANIFIRLSGCNLKCHFCDTDHSRYEEMTYEQILRRLKEYPCSSIIWTGGEPALQLDNKAIDFFNDFGYYQAIETNGTIVLPINLNYIACSPKKDTKILISYADEIRLPIELGDQIIFPDITSKHKYISPIFNGDHLPQNNLDYCIRYCKLNPDVRLSIQEHKLCKIK